MVLLDVDCCAEPLREEVLLRDETRGRIPQLVDPFSKGMSLGRFSRAIPRPESIEPSLFEADRDSGQPSSPLIPVSGPLSGQRSSVELSSSSASRNTYGAPPEAMSRPRSCANRASSASEARRTSVRALCAKSRNWSALNLNWSNRWRRF